ncbi:protein RAFTIN 1B-like [Lolium rigidum]|uniref:protein RAFTIN 1B-like n=1 Tax=Lolium rigidum TaxID=89674 RepID=UPI001F5DCB48|nr:protein RAFTIN 1B-like [Lolium rigidum]
MAPVVVLVLIAVVAGGAAAAVRGHPGDGTPAARFWEAALPGSPMPEAIADLVQKGTDHSPLAEHRSAAMFLPNACLGYKYDIQCGKPPPASTEAAPAVEGIFFREAAMRVGSTMTVALPAAVPAAFLPRDVADRIPFGNLTDALATFNIAPGSQEADQLSDTVRECAAPPLAGERKACATSLEGVVLSATRMLGTRRVAAAASALPSTGLPRAAYVVQATSPLGGSRFVACHSRPYPYAVYQCHMTERSSKAYVVSIRGGMPGDTTMGMAALCHFDTSNWNPAHPAFKILRTHPGGSPVCHFLPYADLLFGEKAANA